MHDVGKIAIPDAILGKPGKLTDAEYEVMKTRCLIAARAGDVERARQELPDISRAYEALVAAIG